MRFAIDAVGHASANRRSPTSLGTRTRAALVVALAVVLFACRRKEPVPERTPVPTKETTAAFLASYANDLVEVANRTDEALSEVTQRKTDGDPFSSYFRIPSPALGTALAARGDVVDLEVTDERIGSGTHVKVQWLRGGRASFGSQSSIGKPLEALG